MQEPRIQPALHPPAPPQPRPVAGGRAMTNLVAQILSLLCALVVSFGVPVVFGLHEYGVFLQGNILVFMFQKLTDIANEPLISWLDAQRVFQVALSVAVLVLALFALVNHVYPIGNVLLLATMLLSSCVLLGMYALRQTLRIILYMLVFLALFTVCVTLRFTRLPGLSIERILSISNAVPSVAAAIALLPRRSGPRQSPSLLTILGGLWKSVPAMLSLTLVSSLFTNIFPFMLSRSLPPASLGLFRVMVALVQSATSLFPLNIKAIFVALVRSDKRGGHYATLMSFSLLYFALGGLVVGIGSAVLPQFYPYTALLCSLPVFYWAVLTERYLLALQRRNYVRIINLLVGTASFIAMAFVSRLDHAITCYALGFSAYTLLLLGGVHNRRLLIVAAVICSLSAVVSWQGGHAPLWVGLYLTGCALAAVFFLQLRWSALLALKEVL